MESKAWHIDRRVSVGHLISTGLIAASAFLFIQKQEVRIGLLEQRLDIEIKRSERVDAELSARIEATRVEGRTERKEMTREIKAEISKVNDKLDSLLRQVKE